MPPTIGARTVINQKAVGLFVRTDLGMQGGLDRGTAALKKRVVEATPTGTGKWHGKFMNHPGLAKRRIKSRTFRWWRRVQTDELAGHIIEWGSPDGIDSIGRHHYETPAYRPFTKAALSSRDIGRFIPRDKPTGGGDE